MLTSSIRLANGFELRVLRIGGELALHAVHGLFHVAANLAAERALSTCALQSVASVVPIVSIDFALRAGPNGCQLAIQDFEGNLREEQEAQDKAVHEEFRMLYTSNVERKALQNAPSKR